MFFDLEGFTNAILLILIVILLTLVFFTTLSIIIRKKYITKEKLNSTLLYVMLALISILFLTYLAQTAISGFLLVISLLFGNVLIPFVALISILGLANIISIIYLIRIYRNQW